MVKDLSFEPQYEGFILGSFNMDALVPKNRVDKAYVLLASHVERVTASAIHSFRVLGFASLEMVGDTCCSCSEGGHFIAWGILADLEGCVSSIE